MLLLPDAHRAYADSLGPFGDFCAAGATRCTDGVKFDVKWTTLDSSTPNFSLSVQGWGVSSQNCILQN